MNRALGVVPYLDLPGREHISGLPHGREQQLGVDTRRQVRILRIVHRREVVWILRDEPRVVLLSKSALLQGAHALDGHSDSERDQVVELQLVWVVELAEQGLDPSKLGVYDAEEQFHPVVGSTVWPDDPVEVLLGWELATVGRP
jgi:hypothetical protein